jgi:hypothetical protein
MMPPRSDVFSMIRLISSAERTGANWTSTLQLGAAASIALKKYRDCGET